MFLINRKSELNIKNKIATEKCVFQAVMLYASPVWERIRPPT